MKQTKQLVRAALFVALMTAGATVRLTIGPVPFTFQTMFCAMGGIILGAKWGAGAMSTYLLLGLMGLPLFAEGGGIGYFFKPTFGYLLGFVPAAWVAGWIYARKHSFGQAVGAMIVALTTIYSIGVPYLFFYFIFVQGAPLGVGEVIAIGLVPFVGPDLLTGVLGAFLAWRLKQLPRFE